MNQKEAIKRFRELSKENRDLTRTSERNRREARRVTEEYFGVALGDSVVYVGPDPSRYTSGIVIEVRGGDVNGDWKHVGSVLVQPWNRNGFGDKLTRSAEARRMFTKKGLLRVVQKAEVVGPIRNIPRTPKRGF